MVGGTGEEGDATEACFFFFLLSRRAKLYRYYSIATRSNIMRIDRLIVSSL